MFRSEDCGVYTKTFRQHSAMNTSQYAMWAHRYRRNYLTIDERAKITWINGLKPDDKLDVMIYCPQSGYRAYVWKVVTVVSLEDAYTTEDDGSYSYYSEQTVQDLCVEYDGSDPSIQKQFTLNIYERTILSRIDKLYSHTSVHNDAIEYYNEQFSACYPRCQASRRYGRMKCIHCDIPFCMNCNVADHTVFNNKFECQKCCITRENDQIFDALSFVFSNKDIDDGSDHFWLNRFISGLSVGVVVECGNFVTCSKEICINNAYEFDGYLDHKRAKISHYTIDNVHKLRDNLKYSIVYGKYRRIFCSECTANVIQRCQHTNCDIRDIFVDNKTEIGKEMYIICGDHLYCESCNFVPLSDY
eukprot:161926_1